MKNEIDKNQNCSIKLCVYVIYNNFICIRYAIYTLLHAVRKPAKWTESFLNTYKNLIQFNSDSQCCNLFKSDIVKIKGRYNIKGLIMLGDIMENTYNMPESCFMRT